LLHPPEIVDDKEVRNNPRGHPKQYRRYISFESFFRVLLKLIGDIRMAPMGMKNHFEERLRYEDDPQRYLIDEFLNRLQDS
jgi:hypothetical protein